MNDLNIEILKGFDINEVESIQRISNGDREMWYVNDKYFLKKFTDLEKLGKMLFLNTELEQAGVPVAKHYKTNAGKFYVEINNEYYSLAEKISGSHDEPDKMGAFLLGQNIAKLHIALIQLSDKTPYPKQHKDEMGILNSFALNEISEKRLAVRKEIIDYCVNFDKLYNNLPRQLIHNDLHRNNILFKSGEITAFLDLEILQTEVRLFDICYYMNAEFDNKDKTEESDKKWLETFKNLLSGYNAVSEVKKEEFVALPYMFIMINLNAIAATSFYGAGQENHIDRIIEKLNWLYDNKSKFSFSVEDMTQDS